LTSDAERWDARYRARSHASEALDPFVSLALDRVARECSAGSALDLACGAGRHAVELARRGWRTEGWDVSTVGLQLCAERARGAGLQVVTRAVDLVRADVPRIATPFDLLVVVDYLERPLLGRLADLVRPQGWLVYATFAPEWPGERPAQRFRIGEDALIASLCGFAPVEVGHERGRAGLLARRSVE
jgi:tellurite methyltransferase